MTVFQDPSATFPPRPWLLVLCLVLTLACGSLHKATEAYEDARYDDALAEYNKVLEKDPTNLEAKIGYRRTAPLAAVQHLNQAEVAKKHGDTDLETKEVGKAVVLDPANAVAQNWLNRLEEAAEWRRAREEAEESLDATRAKDQAKSGLPINPRSLEGLDLNFTRKTSLKEILQQLSRNSGVNILLHASATATARTVWLLLMLQLLFSASADPGAAPSPTCPVGAAGPGEGGASAGDAQPIHGPAGPTLDGSAFRSGSGDLLAKVDDLLTELERLAARRHPVVSWPQKIALTARTYEKKTDSSKLLKSFRDSMNGGGRGA